MSRAVLRLSKTTVASEVDWSELIGRLLPDELPRRQEPCKAVLKSIFQRDLPDGVLQAASSLVALELESEARALLIDFFREKRGSTRIGKRLGMRWIFQQRKSAMAEMTPLGVPSISIVETPPEPEEHDGEVDFEWLPAAAEEMPSFDDSDLRGLAGEAQAKVSETAAGYRAGYESKTIPGWDDVDDWEAIDAPVIIDQSPSAAQESVDQEALVLDRLAALGNDGIALLRYFHDNPGDDARHAADILGYEVVEVSKLVNNKLRDYLRRRESGGWACEDWVACMFELMPK